MPQLRTIRLILILAMVATTLVANAQILETDRDHSHEILWQQDFNEHSLGLQPLPEHMSVTGGRLYVTLGPDGNNGTVQAVGERVYEFKDHVLYRAEVTPEAWNGRGELAFGIRNTTFSRLHIAYFSNGQVYSEWKKTSWARKALGSVNLNKIYIVELETHASGSTVYIYEKGLTRTQGYSDTFTSDPEVWADSQVTVMTWGGSLSGYVDNIVESRALDVQELSELTLAITTPQSEQGNELQYLESEPITLQATAVNAQGDDVSHLIRWRSSQVGEIGEGASVSASLPATEHIITASIASNDETILAEDSVGIIVVSSEIALEQQDSDNDGVNDAEDAFPNDSSETTDSDSDGVGDNADAFPNDPSRQNSEQATTAETLVLRDQTGVSVSNNTITKTAATGAANAGADSVNILAANTDGWVQTLVTETASERTFGLTNAFESVDSGIGTMDYGFRLRANNTNLYVYENGVFLSTGMVGRYTLGDVLRVERVGDTVYYKKNNIALHTSTIKSTSALRFDANIKEQGGVLSNVEVSFPVTTIGSKAGTIRLDFGSNDSIDGWNVVTNSTRSLTDLLSIDGKATNVAITVVDDFNGYNNLGTQESTLGYPAEVTKDNVFNLDENPTSGFLISGLNIDKTYQLSFFASRVNSNENRQAVYTVSGGTQDTVYLNPANNVAEQATVALTPNSNGEISVTMQKGPENVSTAGLFYLGALQISEETNTPAPIGDVSSINLDFGRPETVANWNVIHGNVYNLANLVNNHGEATDINYVQVERLSGYGAVGTTSSTLNYPAAVTEDISFNRATQRPQGAFMLTGLQVDKAYTLSFYASVMNTIENRQTTYTITGQSEQSVSLNPSQNEDKEVSVTLQPNSEGEVVVTVSKGAENVSAEGLYYLGAARISVATPTEPIIIDSDNDGIADSEDAFPNDPSETKDSDNDGVGDNADAFPNDAVESKDSDADGVGDNQDAFPEDPNEIKDTDNDGVGDNKDVFPNDSRETKDSDADGIGDNQDAFPVNSNETVDSDGDGLGDNAQAADALGYALNYTFQRSIELVDAITVQSALINGNVQGGFSARNDVIYGEKKGWLQFVVTPSNEQRTLGFENKTLEGVSVAGDLKNFIVMFNPDGELRVSTAVVDSGQEGVRRLKNFVDRYEVGDIIKLEHSDGVFRIINNGDELYQVATQNSVIEYYPTGTIFGDKNVINGLVSSFGSGELIQSYPDSDGDGVNDYVDAFPNDSAESQDSDGDGVGDNADVYPNDPSRSDNHDIVDISLIMPAVPTLSVNQGDLLVFSANASNRGGVDLSPSIVWTSSLDGDLGVGAMLTILQPTQLSLGVHEITATAISGNESGNVNVIIEVTILDSDGDGVADAQDVFPNNPTESKDADGDGVGDNADAFPQDSRESIDSDGDGVGNNADAYPNDSSRSDDAIAIDMQITSPAYDAQFYVGDKVTLTADAKTRAGKVLDSEIEWRSSIDGVLGNGKLITRILTPGSHFITATAVDGNERRIMRLTLIVENHPKPVLSSSSPIASLRTKYMGTMAGEFRVSENGSATYNINLTVPQGTAGVAPKIALNYSSSAGNGLLGKGWKLSGIPAITRCAKNLAIDGVNAKLEFNENDRFCLNGQRLILVNGTYGARSSTYKTELDSYITVKANGGTLGSPDSFYVLAKDGSTTVYGATPDSKQTIAAGVLSWSQSRFQDSVGNRVDYQYHNDADGQRIQSIQYAYGRAGTTPNARVDFSYQDRPDIISGYIGGSLLETKKRLNLINVFNTENGRSNSVRRYLLFYRNLEPEIQQSVSLLNGVIECVTDGCLPATIFDWQQQPKVSEFNAPTTIVGSDPNGFDSDWISERRFLDINGDGNLDMVVLNQNDGKGQTDEYLLRYFISDGEKLTQGLFSNNSETLFFKDDNGRATSLYNANVRIAVLDYNGDGRQDLAIYKSKVGFWQIHLSQPSGDIWQLSANPINLKQLDSPKYIFVDFNSDGLADAVSPDKIYYLKPKVTIAGAVDQPYAYDERHAQSIEIPAFGKSHKAEIEAYYENADDNPYPNFDCTAGYWFNQSSGDMDGDGDVDIIASRVTRCYGSLYGGRGTFDVVYDGEYSAVFEWTGSGFINRLSVADKRHRIGWEGLQLTDMNGDGLADVVRTAIDTRNWYYRLSTGNGFTAERVIRQDISKGASQQLADVNADGKLDFVYRHDGDKQIKYNLFDGEKFAAPQNLKSIVGSRKADSHSITDLNGDKRADHVRLYPLRSGRKEINLEVSMTKRPDQPDNSIIQITNGLGAKTKIHYQQLGNSSAYSTVDFELSYRYHPSQNYVARGGQLVKCFSIVCSHQLSISDAEKRQLEQTQNFDLSRGVWDLPASSQTISDIPPIIPLNGSINVVTQVDSSAPAARGSARQVNLDGMSSVAYQYAGARMQAGGRGFLGFQYLKTIDLQTNIKTTTLYRQDYPFIGAALKTVTFNHDGKVMEDASNDWRYVERQGADGSRYYQAVLQQSDEMGYQVSTNSSGGDVTVTEQKIKDMSTSNEYDSFGNPTKIVSRTRGYDTNGTVNLTQTKTTTNTYANSSLALNSWGNVSYAQLGRLTKANVVTDLNGKTTRRSSAFTYYDSAQQAGLLRTETIEPGGDKALSLTTTHLYDAVGNPVYVVTQGWDGDKDKVDRRTQQEYDPTGRYISKSYNIYGQVASEVIVRDERGAPSHTRDLSGIETFIKTDKLGREISRSDSVGAWVTTDYLTCRQNECPIGARYGIKTAVAGGGQSVQYFDIVGRSMREGSLGFDGQWIFNDIEYDALGRVRRQSEPFFAGGSALWHTLSYDILGRNWYTKAADNSNLLIDYIGLNVTTTNDFGQRKIETKNALDQLIMAQDHLGGKIAYEYNVDGELTKMSSYRGNGELAASTILEYDALGRKIAMSDPDKGTWYYRYNAFGELIEQTDAKQQRVIQRYDALGRMLSRTDYRADNTVEGHTTWLFDNSPDTGSGANNSRGQLQQIVLSQNINHNNCASASAQQCTLINYDEFGRVLDTQMVLGSLASPGSHKTRIEYDAIGRVKRNYDALDGVVKVAGTTTNSGVEVDYNAAGFAYKSTDLHTNTVLQRIIRHDARGNVLEEIKGNGASSKFQYDPTTGRMSNQYTRSSQGGQLQYIDYAWDNLGNLSYRHNRSAANNQGDQKNLRESFCYDGLNRLIKTHTGTAANSACGQLSVDQQDLRYDSLGNITYKRGVGDYHYDSIINQADSPRLAGLHAVTRTTDGLRYLYDNNGNLTQEEDQQTAQLSRRFHYTTFDKPDEITKGDHTTRFAYGHDHSRYYRQDIDKDGVTTTTYYMAGVERISKSNSDQVEWKRYLGHSIVTVITDGNNNRQDVKQRYVYKDHLGSTDIITDQFGTLIQSMSFDPWGKRRNASDWQALQAVELITFDHSESTKGFTGHEHLDEVGIIHMNGRIYDPRLARFLQADPHVQAPSDTQMLNRYSYVRNNPLNATDPSGYFAFTLAATIAIASGSVSGTAAIVTLVAGAAFADAMVAGASLNDALKAGLIAGASAYAFAQIGKQFSNANAAPKTPGTYKFAGNWLRPEQIATQIAEHGLVGGISAELQGGKFGHGFFSAGFTKGIIGAANLNGDNSNIYGRTALAAVVGGTVSEATGGKFRNGARTAAIAHLFNNENVLGKGKVDRSDQVKKANVTESSVFDKDADIKFISSTKALTTDKKTLNIPSGTKGIKRAVPGRISGATAAMGINALNKGPELPIQWNQGRVLSDFNVCVTNGLCNKPEETMIRDLNSKKDFKSINKYFNDKNWNRIENRTNY